MTESFYNTISETGQTLQESVHQCLKQEDRILIFFKKHPGAEFTPFEVQNYLGMHDSPTTSIRRAMTNLTIANELIKTEHQKTGKYGKKNYLWKLNENKISDQLKEYVKEEEKKEEVKKETAIQKELF